MKIREDEIAFAGDEPTSGDALAPVTSRRAGPDMLSLAGKDLGLDPSEGEIGLIVPDAGYPFGEIPDWLTRQRAKHPDYAK